MRSWFLARKRRGHPTQPLELLLPERAKSTEKPAKEWSFKQSHLLGLITERITFRITEDNRLVETARLDQNWYFLLASGVMLVFLGEILSNLSTEWNSWVLPIRALGLGVCTLGVVVGSHVGHIDATDFNTTTEVWPQWGAIAILVGHLVLGITVGGIAGSIAIAMAAAVVIGYGVSGGFADRFDPIAEAISSRYTDLPLIPRRHIVYSIIATTGLFAYIGLYATIRIESMLQVVAIIALTTVWVGLLLGTINSRSKARTHTVAAVCVTLVAGGSLIFVFPISLAFATPVTTGIETIARVITSCVVICLWLVLLHHLRRDREATRRDFLQTGRAVDTPRAAILAYSVMVSSAFLGMAAILFVYSASQVLAKTMSIAVSAVTVTFALPALYFVGGSLYQSSRLLRTMWSLRRDSTPVPPHTLDRELPISPAHEVWKFQTDDFLAGAYADFWREVIVLSEGAFEELSPAELAAIIAHEESHFQHRGARLQFHLALFTIFTLIGRNVVYSIYDFYAREYRADSYAVRRLDDAGIDGETALQSVLTKLQQDHIDVANTPVTGFLPTLSWTPDTQTLQTTLDEIYSILYSGYAGAAHPREHERLEVIRDERDPELEN